MGVTTLPATPQRKCAEAVAENHAADVVIVSGGGGSFHSGDVLQAHGKWPWGR